MAMAVVDYWPAMLMAVGTADEDHCPPPSGLQGPVPQLRGYLTTDPLQPSGLPGPVELQFGERRQVKR